METKGYFYFSLFIYRQVKNLGQDKEMLIASNKSLAEYNLSMEPKIRQGKEMLCHQYEKARSLKEEYDVLRSVIGNLLNHIQTTISLPVL